MDDSTIEADLAAANPFSEEMMAEVIPPVVGEAMLREITAVKRSSKLSIAYQRMRDSLTVGVQPARIGFVGVVAAVLLAVGFGAASIRSTEPVTGPADRQAIDNQSADNQGVEDQGAEDQDCVTSDVSADCGNSTSSASEPPVEDSADAVGNDPQTGPEENSSSETTVDGAPTDQPDNSQADNNQPDNNEQDADQPAEASQDNAVAIPISPSSESATDAFDRNLDLISLHFDHTTPSDSHATVAAQTITDILGVDRWVVSGTYGTNPDAYLVNSEPLMDITWGNGNWRNADDNLTDVVAETANRWEATLNRGGDVWVAEGGQSDFTADVVRELLLRRASTPTQRIHVVQHSQDNETTTTPADLTFIQANSDYIAIADGSIANTTADLEGATDGWKEAALDSQRSEAWSAAFEQLDPDEQLNFSDSVAVLYIVGVGLDQVADPDDFANLFFQ